MWIKANWITLNLDQTKVFLKGVFLVNDFIHSGETHLRVQLVNTKINFTDQNFTSEI